MIFFPSYRMLEDIHAIFKQQVEQNGLPVECICQTSGMSEQEREEFLACFEEERSVRRWLVSVSWVVYFQRV